MQVKLVVDNKSFDLEAADVMVLRKSLQNTKSFFERLLTENKIEENRVPEFKNRKARAKEMLEMLEE